MSDLSSSYVVGTTATKAIVGAVYSGVVAFLATLGTALVDGSIAPLEWVTIASATVVAIGGSAGLIYTVPNTPKYSSGE